MSLGFHAHGKLLLTGEYFVLDGACALAFPVKYGQSLTISENPNSDILHWQSFDEKEQCWFEATFHSKNFNILKHTDKAVANRLKTILTQIKNQNPALQTANCKLQTELNFPRNWGLGTSSTLIYLLTKWANIDPFELQFQTFEGSGYDIACAGAAGPILYKKENGRPVIKSAQFNPPFAHQLYFVFLGKKQDSREGIERFKGKRKKEKGKSDLAEEVSTLTNSFLMEADLKDFEKLIAAHEKLIGDFIGLPRAKNLYFNDFWGEIKSLGAWGGDFVLATSDRPKEETQRYFNEKGFSVFIPYNDMVL